MGKYFHTRPHTTGTFPGHAIPATVFFTGGAIFLIAALRRARNLKAGESFAKKHIPEKSTELLGKLSRFLMPFLALGMAMETGGGWYAKGNPFFQLAHTTIYFSYFLVALCANLETKRKLPPDSFRVMMVVGLVGEYVIWNSHAAMKKEMSDALMHRLLAYMCLLNAAVTAYSIKFTDSIFAYVASWGLRCLQGSWLMTAGVYEGYIDIKMHYVSSLLSLEASFICLIIMLSWAYFGPEPLPQDDPEFRREFSPLNSKEDDDIEVNGHAMKGF